MNLIKKVVLVLLISNSFVLLAQDKSNSEKDKNELTKPSTQEKPLTINSSGLNYAYKAKDSQTVTSVENLDLIYDINVKDLPTVTFLENTEKKTFEFSYSKKAEGGTLIDLGTLNVPHGSVRVTAGNQLLYEGIDYTVNYQAGTVQIIDASWAATNKLIRASVEKSDPKD